MDESANSKIAPTKPLGHIVNISNNKTFIIDVGKPELDKGDEILVYEDGTPVYDLAGKVLGVYDPIKIRLEVTEVYANFSICRRIIYVESTLSLITNPLGKPSRKYDHVNVAEKEISNLPMHPLNEQIKIGDPVKRA
jgi:hypothetical protein